MSGQEPDVAKSLAGSGAAPAGIALDEGFSWTWSLDFETLLAALSEPAPWNRPPKVTADTTIPTAGTDSTGGTPTADTGNTDATDATDSTGSTDAIDPAEADFADYLGAVDAGRTAAVPLSMAAGRVAELLPASPDLAAWLACNPAADLEDGALAGAAAAYRRVASWAQAGELAIVAQMASRSAASDEKNGVDENGRPERVPADAYGQVSLALTMSQTGAEWWTDLAVNLQWRLAATGDALRAGTIDLSRAKAIADATSVLDDKGAQTAEAKVLPKASEQTIGQLRASLRRAVIAADPEGAERRREEAEKRAKVTLYPDAEGTASLSGQSLPGVRAAAAMARITALARALKASGATGGIDLLRSKVFLGLLLGTLPYIPPPSAGPSDADRPPGNDDEPRDGSPANGPASDDCPPQDSRPMLDDWPWNDDNRNDDSRPGKDSPTEDRTTEDSPTEDRTPVGANPADEECLTDCPADKSEPSDDGCAGEGAPDHGLDEKDSIEEDRLKEDRLEQLAGAVPWPQATPLVPPGPTALGNLMPAGSGFLDLRLPWLTLALGGAEPGYLTRLGPITPAQASYLALLAAQDPAVEWRVALTDASGRAVAVARVKRGRSPAGPARAGPHGAGLDSDSSLIQRVTVTITELDVAMAEGGISRAEGNLAKVLAAIVTAAREAGNRAAEQAAADAEAGGCAHTQASAAYQVPARLREFVNLRDLTCQFPTCRQPAWRCDADHTQPFDQGGLTCSCNLGALCRRHHKLKQHSRWRLDQPAPGTFIWTTPTGRTYTTQPDLQAA